METTMVNKGINLNFDTRITKGRKDASKRRADVFFRPKQGEFIAFADSKNKRVQFKLQRIQKELPQKVTEYSREDLRLNFERIHREVTKITKLTIHTLKKESEIME